MIEISAFLLRLVYIASDSLGSVTQVVHCVIHLCLIRRVEVVLEFPPLVGAVECFGASDMMGVNIASDAFIFITEVLNGIVSL